MKKFFYIIVALLVMGMVSCGHNGKKSAEEKQDSIVQAQRDSVERVKKVPTLEQIEAIADTAKDSKNDRKETLKELGMHLLRYEVSVSGDKGSEAFYGKNAVVDEVGDGEFKMKPCGEHAMVVRQSKSKSLRETLYFSEKADYEAFKKSVPADKTQNWKFSDKPQDSLYVATRG